MTLNSYIESLKNKSIAVIGLGVSNRPLVNLLLNAGCMVTARDKRSKEQLGEFADEIESRGCRLCLGDGYLDQMEESVIFRTPGLHPFTPQLVDAQKRGALITSEMEVFFSLCPSRIIAVTGSDGKTTTTTLISEFLKAEGYRVFVGGNIGTPLLDKVPEMREWDFVVLELSSFQLHSMDCRPDVSVITNISPNHLDIHPSYQDYQDAKKQIFVQQKENDLLILNADNEISSGFEPQAVGSVRKFSRNTIPANGVCLIDNIIFRVKESVLTEVMPADIIRIPGLHNVENYMAAMAATADYVSDESVKKVAVDFPGVAHRLEMIRVLNGVSYCNDSIASSPSRTIAGLHALKQKPILIAGGYDKNIPFDSLGDEICKHVKSVFLTGFTAEKIHRAIMASSEYDPQKLQIHLVEDFKEAVLAASSEAVEGDMVLLSPACASFDHFKNFEERGNTFRKIVMDL